MTRAQENRFVMVLQAKRDELVCEIVARRGRLAVRHANDPMDRARSSTESDATACNLNLLHDTLRHVDNALQEIRDSTFGVCAGCGRQIPLQRLEAVPWSPFCITCQARAERRETGGGQSEDELYAVAS
jgi:DnaK suppressor protein